ncbi:MAG: class I SAM-dependent methyltransferase [Pseudomonadota bacterium]
MSVSPDDLPITFGFQSVSPEEKTRRVGSVFRSVAQRYDIMNDLMSVGIHRFWKKLAIEYLSLREGQQVLDLAGGTGDLSRLASRKVGDNGLVVVGDINWHMMHVGRDRCLNSGENRGIRWSQLNAEQLPFADNTFDRMIIGFGFRNVTHKEQAISEMYRILKPGGLALILEFSMPKSTLLKKMYTPYLFHVLPWLGEHVVGDRDSYQYLAESIRMHPSPEKVRDLMLERGFISCQIIALHQGLVTLHRALKSP